MKKKKEKRRPSEEEVKEEANVCTVISTVYALLKPPAI